MYFNVFQAILFQNQLLIAQCWFDWIAIFEQQYQLAHSRIVAKFLVAHRKGLENRKSLRHKSQLRSYFDVQVSRYRGLLQDNSTLFDSHGGNQEKTRSLIKKYYGRVIEANKYFSSYTEGWRTDRGMIYILFGSPGTVYKSAESESWIYGTPNSTLALNFFFIKVNNPFTDNDYTLSRSPTYESSWYRAVEIWRQGRVYNSFN